MATLSSYYASSPSMLRTITVVPVSAFVTLALLFCMFTLIKNDYEYNEEPKQTPKIVSFVMPKVGPIVDIFEPPTRPVEPPVPPVTPPTEISFDPPAPTVIQVERVKPTIVPGNLLLAGGDQLMPFIKIQPNYPSSASTRGIEGFVDVVFDVSTMGTTENIRVSRAEPSTIFNSSVIKAIKGWKYKPRVVEGVATKTFDVRERITFKLDN